MTREEKQKAIDAIKISAPVMAMTQEEFNDYIQTINQIMDWLEQKPSEDAISRQAAIDACLNGWNKDYKEIVEEIRTLPPVTPQPKTGWIPVSEKLPKKFSYVNCTCHSLIDDREDWVVETFYLPQPKISPYSDWGNIPMLNRGECEVVAWMYREIPKPYKAESEVQDDAI